MIPGCTVPTQSCRSRGGGGVSGPARGGLGGVWAGRVGTLRTENRFASESLAEMDLKTALPTVSGRPMMPPMHRAYALAVLSLASPCRTDAPVSLCDQPTGSNGWAP